MRVSVAADEILSFRIVVRNKKYDKPQIFSLQLHFFSKENAAGIFKKKFKGSYAARIAFYGIRVN